MDAYYLWNENLDMSIWIANKDYGIEFKKYDNFVNDKHIGARWCNYPLSKQSKEELYEEIKKIIEYNINKNLADVDVITNKLIKREI